MSEALVISWALVAGLDWRVTVILACSLAFPVFGLAAVAIHVMRNRGGTSTAAAVFCHSTARELRSGATLRSALADSARVIGMEQVADDLDRGAPLGSVIPGLASGIPEVEAEVAALVAGVAGAGSASAALFEELGDLALAHVEMVEETRAATAPARASALVLIGLPLAYLGYVFSNEGLGDLLADPAQAGMALAGGGLAGLGLFVGWWLVRWSL